jgi:hypothetical protein
MKDKLSITINRSTHMKMKESMRRTIFKSKSQFIEYVILKFIGNED